ncbi:AcrR family transcriptional regulator [Aequitasia blattaphilus]|uniref:TetR/AcrR family transcriptional regulator n=1 Tax=Aequitasia blattaphilus TaxID=2949332 RepID=A0ABT1EBJ5_9FIRM|nr:TetR/AcrR family transcriptional regulator [Aequitasia blattaphilus]MCP1103204.1 TetR/AcrR family transcriptional regulator [Aequitasia blattaphilus]MCR8615844.1 TetR/AcrR family transcriptional regulator [Aequitasia blattaphilus]
MRTFNAKLRAAILEAGQKEFLKYGFEKATLRRIAAAAQVTTGAIYTYFPDKAALFEALVSGTTEKLKEQIMASVNEMDETLRKDITPWRKWLDINPDILVDYLYEHFDAFRLLCCSASGTSYENYIDSLIEIETESTIRFTHYLRQQKILKRDIDEEAIHIITSTYYAGIFEPIIHEMPKEQALGCVRVLEEFYTAGWQKILGF